MRTARRVQQLLIVFIYQGIYISIKDYQIRADIVHDTDASCLLVYLLAKLCKTI